MVGKRVLVISRGIKYDPFPFTLYKKLVQAGISADFVDLSKATGSMNYYKNAGSKKLSISNKTLDYRPRVVIFRGFEDINFRLPYAPNSEEYFFTMGSISAFIYGAMRLFDSAVWINSPLAIHASKYKIQQLEFAKELGFNVPDTLVTNDYSEILRFLKTHEDCITKPLGPHVVFKDEKFVYTNTISAADVRRLRKSIKVAPFIVQEEMRGKASYRITVIGNRAFSVKITPKEEKDKVDWRRYSSTTKYERADPPKSVLEKCALMTKKYGLKFSTIDLIEDKDGKIHFLELNPSGQYEWLQAMCKINITDYFINYIGKLVGK